MHRRGTTNTNVRGSAESRRRRKAWLLANFSKRLGPTKAKCAFRLNKLGQNKPDVVTGIVVAAGKR